MTRYIKIIVSFVVPIFFFSCSEKHVQYTLPDIALTLEIPSSFKVLTAAQNDTLNKKGLKLVEDVNHISIDASQTKMLMTAKKNDLNFFAVTMTPYDIRVNGSYMESVKLSHDLIYNTFHNKMPGVKIDTMISRKTIGDREFVEIHFIIPIKEKITMNLVLLSRYYQGFDLDISYEYMDHVSKNQMEEILKSCKFAY